MKNEHLSDITSCYYINVPREVQQRDPLEVDVDLKDSMVRGSVGDRWMNDDVPRKAVLISDIDGNAGLSRLGSVEERVPVPEEIIA